MAPAQQNQKRARKEARLEARVTPKQKRLLERAAGLRGTSVTEFVLASAHAAALETIRETEVLSLESQARDSFVRALLHPPLPNAAAKAAARRYRKQMGL